MSQIWDSLMQPAPAILRSRKTVTSWHPMVCPTLGVETTFAAVGLLSGTSTTEIFECCAWLQLGFGAPSG